VLAGDTRAAPARVLQSTEAPLRAVNDVQMSVAVARTGPGCGAAEEGRTDSATALEPVPDVAGLDLPDTDIAELALLHQSVEELVRHTRWLEAQQEQVESLHWTAIQPCYQRAPTYPNSPVVEPRSVGEALR
jgi:hypothetical protein